MAAASRGLALTLELLPSPSKAVVCAGFGGAAAQLWLASSNPARCFTYRQPYDADVFESEGHSSPSGLEAPLDAAARGVALRTRPTKPQRPIGWVALNRIASTRNICITVARNEAIGCLLVINRWFTQLYEEEERAELEEREPVPPKFPQQAMQQAVRRGAYNSCLDLAVQALRALLDWAAAARVHAELAGRLIKELRSSAARKARLPWYNRPVCVTRTALLSEATLYTADALVSSAVEAYGAVRWYKGPWQQRLRRLGARSGLHFVRGAVVLCAVSLGNGVGSVSPVYRSHIMFVCSQAASLWANSYMIALMERLTAQGPPAKGGAGDAWPPAAAADAGDAQDWPLPPQQALLVAEPVLAFNAQAQPGMAAAAAEAAVEAVGGGVAHAAVQAQAHGGGLPQDVGVQAQAHGGGVPQDVGVQAEPDGPEPPVPAPQQRRVVGGPRLPERPQRRLAGVGGVAAPQPQAPHTPQFRDQRAPTPEGQESEDAEAAARAAAAGGGFSPAAAPSTGSSASAEPAAAAGEAAESTASSSAAPPAAGLGAAPAFEEEEVPVAADAGPEPAE